MKNSLINLKNGNSFYILEDTVYNNKNYALAVSINEDDKFELVVSRAVARIDKLTKFCMPIVKKNGTFIAMKAKFTEEESLIDKKYNNYKIIKFNLPIENSERSLVIFNK